MTEADWIQGVAPQQVIRTNSADELAEAVRSCAESGRAVADYGQSHRGLGHAPPAGHVQILPAMGVIEHYVADTAVRVCGGHRLAHLQRALAERGQYLPLDGADEQQTIAEIIAHNVYGPLRVSQGAARDLLLGVRFVDGRGRVLTVGGRTVKNVAGYDVTRFMIGSLNQFGLIADATLRTAALPSRVVRVTVCGLTPGQIDPHITPLLTGDAAPYYMDWQTQRRGGAVVEHTLHLGYAGTPRGTATQVESLEQWLAGSAASADASDEEGDWLTDEAARAARRSWRTEASAWVKLIVPPTSAGSTIEQLLALPQRIGTIDALPAHGVIHLGADWSAREAQAADERLVQLAVSAGGLRVWHRRPNHSPMIDPVAPPQSDWPMLRRLKQTLDPQNLLNPGRML